MVHPKRRVTIHSYAKLNLFLEVIRRRKDAYHDISTLFERISLHDTIILSSRLDGKIELTCNSLQVPKDSSNLAYKSAKLLRDAFNIKQGVNIRLIKRIPVGSGMGGGSSNAAAVLLGLNRLWGLKLSKKVLVKYAKTLGSDVPFFIYDCRFAIGSKRGEDIRELSALKTAKFWHCLAIPRLAVSTPLIYTAWDKKKASQNKNEALTLPKYNVKILTSILKKKDFSLLSQALFNSLEQITVGIYPEVKRVKQAMLAFGSKAVLMSGSGPSVFSVFSSRKEALTVYRQLKSNSSWQVFLTHTL